MTEKRKVPFYVTLEPRWSRHYNDNEGNPVLEGVAATKLTQKRPDRDQRGGTVVMKLVVAVPESLFQPLQPQVIIDVPESAAQVIPIEVTAEHPGIFEPGTAEPQEYGEEGYS